MGGLFSKPAVPETHAPAPAVQEPVKEVKSPEMGAQETTAEKNRKGKKGLKIDLNTTRGSSGGGVGLNTPR